MQVGTMTGHGTVSATGTETGTGTGHILSNTHYVEGGQVTIRYQSGNRYSLKTQLRDTRADTAHPPRCAHTPCSRLCLYGVGAVFPRLWRTLWMRVCQARAEGTGTGTGTGTRPGHDQSN